jgi:hypothetical protein
MELSRYAKGALVFTAASVALTLIDVSTMYRNPEWMMSKPGWWRDIMPPMINVLVPVVFVAIAFGAWWVLSGKRTVQRNGYYVLLLVAVLSIVVSILTTYWRVSDGLFQASVVCAVQIVTNAAVIYYCIPALREGVRATTSEATGVRASRDRVGS